MRYRRSGGQEEWTGGKEIKRNVQETRSSGEIYRR
jgi:hypothetical protein